MQLPLLAALPLHASERSGQRALSETLQHAGQHCLLLPCLLRMLLQAGDSTSEGLHAMQSDDLRSQSLPITVVTSKEKSTPAFMVGRTHVQMSLFSQD